MESFIFVPVLYPFFFNFAEIGVSHNKFLCADGRFCAASIIYNYIYLCGKWQIFLSRKTVNLVDKRNLM